MQRRQPRSTRTDTRLPYTPLFRSRTVDRYQPGVTGKPARMHGLLFGLFGPNAPLPLHLTEYAMDRQTNARASTFTASANIFHHRMTSLFYRAWADSQPTMPLARTPQDRSRLSMCAMLGLSTPTLYGRADRNRQTVL